MLSSESLFNISLCCIKWHVRHIVWSPAEPGAGRATGGRAGGRLLGPGLGHCGAGAGSCLGRLCSITEGFQMSSVAQLLASRHANPSPANEAGTAEVNLL